MIPFFKKLQDFVKPVFVTAFKKLNHFFSCFLNHFRTPCIYFCYSYYITILAKVVVNNQKVNLIRKRHRGTF